MKMNQLELASTPMGVFAGCAATAAMMSGQEVDLRDIEVTIQVNGQDVDLRRVLTMWAATPQAQRATSLAAVAPAPIPEPAPAPTPAPAPIPLDEPVPVLLDGPAPRDILENRVGEMNVLLNAVGTHLDEIEATSYMADATLDNAMAKIIRAAAEEFTHEILRRGVTARLTVARDLFLQQMHQTGGAAGVSQRVQVRRARESMAVLQLMLAGR